MVINLWIPVCYISDITKVHINQKGLRGKLARERLPRKERAKSNA